MHQTLQRSLHLTSVYKTALVSTDNETWLYSTKVETIIFAIQSIFTCNALVNGIWPYYFYYCHYLALYTGHRDRSTSTHNAIQKLLVLHWGAVKEVWKKTECLVPVDLKDRREGCLLDPRKSGVVYIRWWKTSCPNARSIDLSWCMQDGVEEALGDMPTTFACLMIQTTINTQVESALCMEFNHGEKENFKPFTTTISPVLCAAYASSEGDSEWLMMWAHLSQFWQTPPKQLLVSCGNKTSVCTPHS